MSDLFTQNHLSAAPAVPDSESLDRVRVAAAIKARATAPRTVSRTSLRIAAGVAVAALVLGAFAYVMQPRVDDSAFARQQAIDALLPTTGVLHVKSTFTDRSQNASWGVLPERVQTWESWTDITHKVSRDEVHEADGSLGELTIRSGDVTRMLGRDGGLDPKTHAYVPMRYRMVKFDQPSDLPWSPFGGIAEGLRSQLENGKAKVVARIREGNDEYWVVECVTGSDSTGDKLTIRATMRVGDYALKQISGHGEGNDPGVGHTVDEQSWDITTWETVARTSLPNGFFDLNQPDKAAPKGTIFDTPKLK